MNIDPGFGVAAPGMGRANFGNIDPGFNRGPVGGYDPRILSQRRNAILQKLMAQHAQNLPQNGPGSGSASGMHAIAQASHMQANGIGGRRPNAAKINVTGGQNLSASILARLGLTLPRALLGEHSQSPGNAIDMGRTDVGGQMPNPNYRPSAPPAPIYPGDPTASLPPTAPMADPANQGFTTTVNNSSPTMIQPDQVTSINSGTTPSMIYGGGGVFSNPDQPSPYAPPDPGVIAAGGQNSVDPGFAMHSYQDTTQYQPAPPPVTTYPQFPQPSPYEPLLRMILGRNQAF